MKRRTQQKNGCHMETLLNNLKLGLATAATGRGEGEADCDGRFFYGDDNFDARDAPRQMVVLEF